MSPETENELAPGEAATNDLKAASQFAMAAGPRKRERRIKNLEVFAEPLSPCSSSSSHAGDCNFEPTIDMMVNDFDDEQTLNEEETLAALEQNDPKDEISTLKEESEMPLEQLLAKYQCLPPAESSHKKKKKSKKCKSNSDDHSSTTATDSFRGETPNSSSAQDEQITKNGEQTDVIVIESGDEDIKVVAANFREEQEQQQQQQQQEQEQEEEEEVAEGIEPKSDCENMNLLAANTSEEYDEIAQPKKLRRSHLLDLYPEESHAALEDDHDKVVELDVLYGDEDEDDDEDDIEDDFVKKTIMVGAAYQAVIPEGLSQYGDVLPYENEDKLIWEPSQVSEREVEEYLLNARNIKPTLTDEELMQIPTSDDMENSINACLPNPVSKSIAHNENNYKADDTFQLMINENKVLAQRNNVESELCSVVKDNEQALHLLVLCGYDFKEALRRKRLNALPLTGSMSLWSEEECQKFEEGIQKYGKDFLKIRQHQVRTRSMRELVQFYYLWKKSERRDHNFANSDTVDHMEIYLNESEDYGTSATSTQLGTTALQASSFTTRKANVCVQKNLSIMAGSNANSSKTISQLNAANAKVISTQRKRDVAGAAGVNNNNKQKDSLISVSSAK